MTPGLGHNNGPSLEPGTTWRTQCWRKARAELLPHLPLEVLRLRVARAREIGLEYRTYASFRASTGHDVIGFLFSGNALRVHLRRHAMPADRTEKLASIGNCDRIAMIPAPLSLEAFARANPGAVFESLASAPGHLASWAQARDSIGAVLSERRLPRDGVLLIGDATLERNWSEAGRLAGYLGADRYFAAAG